MQVIDHAGGESGVYTLYADHLGNTSVTADETGLSTSALLYKAWGETRSITGNAHTEHQYTGHTARSASAKREKKPNLACT